MPEGVARDSYIGQGSHPKLDNGNILYNTGPDRSGDPLTELLEWMQNYYIPIKSFASTHTPPVVRPSTPFYPEQVQIPPPIIGKCQSPIFGELADIFANPVTFFP